MHNYVNDTCKTGTRGIARYYYLSDNVDDINNVGDRAARLSSDCGH